MATIMHINYCEQGQSIEQACRLAHLLGFDGIEFRSRPGNLPLDVYLDQIAAAYEKEGLTAIHFGGSVSLNHPEQEERHAAIEKFLTFYKAALQRFPLGVCNLQTDWLENKSTPFDHYECHGSALVTDQILSWQTEGLRRIADFAEENKFRFALETHHCYPHDLPIPALNLVRSVQSPALGVLLDYGNIIGFADPPTFSECLDILKDSIFYLHLKNSLATGTRYRQRCALSEGEINHRKMLNLLRDHGYTGNFCIESPRKGDRTFFAKSDAAYMKELLAETEN